MKKLIRIYLFSKGPLHKTILSGFYEHLSSVSDLDIREEECARAWHKVSNLRKRKN